MYDGIHSPVHTSLGSIPSRKKGTKSVALHTLAIYRNRHRCDMVGDHRLGGSKKELQCLKEKKKQTAIALG